MGWNLIYTNPLQKEEDIKGWVKEGEIVHSFDEGLVLENGSPESLGDDAHWTFWIPEEFPSDIEIQWEFFPIREPGLCMLFFSAAGIKGGSIFHEGLKKRTGFYPEYHSSDINAYHISYFRHKHASERAFRTCNLRKSAGFHFVVQGADPLPPVQDVQDFYRLTIQKKKGNIIFKINDLTIFDWHDDGQQYGPVLGKGNIAFRQMAPMKAKYRHLKISEWID